MFIVEWTSATDWAAIATEFETHPINGAREFLKMHMLTAPCATCDTPQVLASLAEGFDINAFLAEAGVAEESSAVECPSIMTVAPIPDTGASAFGGWRWTA
jgi:hypothetical protein